MFAQHPGNQGREGGVDKETERRKERKERKENHIAAKSALVSSSNYYFSFLRVNNMRNISVTRIVAVFFLML